MATIVKAVAKIGRIEEKDLRHRHGGAPRMLAAWIGWNEGLLRLREIAAALRLRSSGNGDRELAGDEQLQHWRDKRSLHCSLRKRTSAARGIGTAASQRQCRLPTRVQNVSESLGNCGIARVQPRDSHGERSLSRPEQRSNPSHVTTRAQALRAAKA
jgi:hypothetical protein